MMALNKLHALHDEKVSQAYLNPPIDKDAARKPFLKSIERERKKAMAGTKPRGSNAWWSENAAGVEFHPKHEGRALDLGKAIHTAKDKLVALFDALKEHVTSGDLDDQIVDRDTPAKTRKPRAASTATGDRPGWSDERRERFAASIAQRKAAKAAVAGK